MLQTPNNLRETILGWLKLQWNGPPASHSLQHKSFALKWSRLALRNSLTQAL